MIRSASAMATVTRPRPPGVRPAPVISSGGAEAELLSKPPFYWFGPFRLDARTGEISSHGTKAQLREQPFQLLLALIETPGELIPREDLVRRLWPDGTFIDFDRGLNKAVLSLREALGDSAENPRFVETLPRKGYRFIAAVSSEPQERADQPTALCPEPASRSLLWIAGVTMLAALALVLAANPGRLRDRIAARLRPSPQISALAVIPLENLSHDPEQEFFADGITDELITNLAKITQARVVSRTSVMRFKGSRKTLKEIAHELNVDAVVEGTVESSGNRIRITARLIQVGTDSHLWAESYEQELSEILDLQKNVATDIARQVDIVVKPLRSAQPVNPVAYVAYLKGRYEFYRYTKEGWQKAIDYFSESIRDDPESAPGHVGLAASYLAAVGWEALPPEELSKGESEARKAIELDDKLPGAHFVMAAAYTERWRWWDAENEFRRGLELDPNDALGRQWYSNYLVTMGRFQEAISQQENARFVDPFSPLINTNLAKAFYYARQFNRAAAQAQEALQLDPKYRAAWMFLERSNRHMGKADLAVKARLSSGSLEESQRISQAYRDRGLNGVLRSEAEEYQKAGALFDAARCYVQAGDTNLGFALLEESLKRRYPGFPRLLVDPDFDPVRSDPRLQDLLIRAGLRGNPST
jgi:TolB-like protein/DNA-binding winged helix-turn-helix (wHTH) protein/Tfp pilus assembly protein PilF